MPKEEKFAELFIDVVKDVLVRPASCNGFLNSLAAAFVASAPLALLTITRYVLPGILFDSFGILPLLRAVKVEGGRFVVFWRYSKGFGL